MKRIAQSIPGGTWKDWDSSLVAPCHTRESGKTYTTVYSRMPWDDPAPTLTTQFFNYGSGKFGHPEQNRAISLREGALLQTFPKSYAFFEHGKPYSLSKLGTLIGNAVPVKLAQHVGYSIASHLGVEIDG